MTLRPSAFYAAAGLRTAVLKGGITQAALRNLTRTGRAPQPGCLREALAAIADGARLTNVGRAFDECQHELCGVRNCNLNQ